LVWLSVTLPLLVWLFIVTELAQAGIFMPGALGRLPAIPLAVVLPIAIALPLLIRSKHITAMIDVIPPSWLIGLQVYRALGAVFLVRWAAGQLPGEFAIPAGVGDIL